MQENSPRKTKGYLTFGVDLMGLPVPFIMDPCQGSVAAAWIISSTRILILDSLEEPTNNKSYKANINPMFIFKLYSKYSFQILIIMGIARRSNYLPAPFIPFKSSPRMLAYIYTLNSFIAKFHSDLTIFNFHECQKEQRSEACN